MTDQKAAQPAPQVHLSAEVIARENFAELKLVADYWKQKALLLLAENVELKKQVADAAKESSPPVEAEAKKH